MSWSALEVDRAEHHNIRGWGWASIRATLADEMPGCTAFFRVGLLLSFGLGVCGCSCDDQPAPASSATASASAQAPEAPVARKLEVVSFAAEDKVPLKADVLSAESNTAPLLVLVHRFRGDRSEWAPLLTRLASAGKQYRVVSPDLRGHGDSKSAGGELILDWGAMKTEEVPHMERDVEAAVAFGRKGFEPSHVVLIGSSLGATLAARVAAKTPEVKAIALLSPGARIEGLDVYTAFAEVRGLRSFLAAGNGDNVSRAPIGSLMKMAKQGTLKEYESTRHSAQHLGADAPTLWADVEEWLMQGYELAPEGTSDAPAVDLPADADAAGDGGG